MVFFAGLPGTGKSLLVQQLAHLAHARGRTIHLLQWDVARPVFEASDAGRRYPMVDGVTHALVRKAVGAWVRRALAAWDRHHAEPAHLLLGETPLIGHRFIELARRGEDGAERLLASPACRFAIPVPSREVRAFLEAERARRAAHPLHAREREDAPPQVLRDLWRELVAVAPRLGVAGNVAGAGSGGTAPTPAWDPEVYGGVYAALLRHRHAEVLPMATVLPTSTLSVYDFAVPLRDLVPTPDEADTCVRAEEARSPDLAALEREVARWWEV